MDENFNFEFKEDGFKYKLYIIGSISMEEKIEKIAQLYADTGDYDVRYVKDEPNRPLKELIEQCFSNIRWADRVLIVPKEDGSIGDGVTYEMAFADFVGKRYDIVKRGITNVSQIRFV